MNGFPFDKYSKLVQLIYNKTSKREMAWAVNAENQLYATIGRNTIFVMDGLNQNGEDLITFQLFGVSGKLSDAFNDENLAESDSRPVGFENWFLICNAINVIGRRQASGADDVLDELLADLDDDVPF